MTVEALRQIARAQGLRNVSTLRKSDLIAYLEAQASEGDQASESTPEPLPSEERKSPRPDFVPAPAWAAVLLQGAGTVALILSLVAMVALPLLRPKAVAIARSFLDSTNEQVEALAQTTDRGAQSLALAADSLSDAAQLLEDTQDVLVETGPLLENIAVFLGEDAPATLEATQRALDSSQAGAAAIDSTLRTLSLLGPLTGVEYDPEQSLSASLAETAQSLDPLPAALRSMQTDVGTVQENLDSVPLSMGALRQDLHDFSQEVGELSEAFEDQGQQLDALQSRVDQAQTGVRRGLLVAMIILEALLLWFVSLALGLLVLGRQVRWQWHELEQKKREA